jgi:hypothetical protein
MTVPSLVSRQQIAGHSNHSSEAENFNSGKPYKKALAAKENVVICIRAANHRERQPRLIQGSSNRTDPRTIYEDSCARPCNFNHTTVIDLR